jgi:hypothetical protein
VVLGTTEIQSPLSWPRVKSYTDAKEFPLSHNRLKLFSWERPFGFRLTRLRENGTTERIRPPSLCGHSRGINLRFVSDAQSHVPLSGRFGNTES